MPSYEEVLTACVRQALVEDLGVDPPHAGADVTSRLAFGGDVQGRARILARASGRVAGLDAAVGAFVLLDPRVGVERHVEDGDDVGSGDVLVELEGPAAVLMAGERTALNFLQHLSGVATATRALVDAVAGTGAVILDTRKTTPGLRRLEKRAVCHGGGRNHRSGLYDQVLLKENHFALAREPYEDVVARCASAVEAAVVAEARDVAEARAAVRGGAAVVLLDNFAPGPGLQEAVAVVRSEAERAGRPVSVEVSGGIGPDTARAFASCGVDRLSVGGITHSAPVLDVSMLVDVGPAAGGAG